MKAELSTMLMSMSKGVIVLLVLLMPDVLGLKCYCDPKECDFIRPTDCPGKGIIIKDPCKWVILTDRALWSHALPVRAIVTVVLFPFCLCVSGAVMSALRQRVRRAVGLETFRVRVNHRFSVYQNFQSPNPESAHVSEMFLLHVFVFIFISCNSSLKVDYLDSLSLLPVLGWKLLGRSKFSFQMLIELNFQISNN